MDACEVSARVVIFVFLEVCHSRKYHLRDSTVWRRASIAARAKGWGRLCGKRWILAALMASLGMSGHVVGAGQVEPQSLGGWGYDTVALQFTFDNGVGPVEFAYRGRISSGSNFACKGRPVLFAGVPAGATDVTFEVSPSSSAADLWLCTDGVQPRTEILPLDDDLNVVTLDAGYEAEPRGKGKKKRQFKAPLLVTFESVDTGSGLACSTPGTTGRRLVGCLLPIPRG